MLGIVHNFREQSLLDTSCIILIIARMSHSLYDSFIIVNVDTANM